MLLHAFVNNGTLLKIKRFKKRCVCDAIKVQILKKLRKLENINNEIFSDILLLEHRTITVVNIHLNKLKHCVAIEFRYPNQLNRTKLCLDVILTLSLKSAEIPLL